MQRDARCVDSRLSLQVSKRMGTGGTVEAVTRFGGEQVSAGIHRFGPRIGVLLCLCLDARVKSFKLDFYHVSVSYRTKFGILLLKINAV